jgi:hypothetical protein
MSKSESADSPLHIVRDGRTYKVFCGPSQLIVQLASGKHLPVEFLNREAAEGYIRWRRRLVAEESIQAKPRTKR